MTGPGPLVPFAPLAPSASRLPLVTSVVLQEATTMERLVDGATEVVWLSVLAGALAALVALVYRWYVRERVPSGLPVLFGLSAVALYLGTSRALRQVIGNTGDPFDEATALLNVATFVVALLAARAGTDVGDRVGNDLFAATGSKTVESEVSRVVQAVGRVITVEIPEEIDDIVGYDPVPAETKAKLAGKTFVFPRRLTVSELRDRLVTRLKADYAVGHVDIELADDGTVAYLALGSRAAGIGPTLPPETSAVAVRADPAFAASAGDLVQVWKRDPFERVLTAEVRAVVDDVVTLAVDAADTRKLDDGTTYRLVTLPVESRPDREFVSLLQAADETMAAVTGAAGSQLDGQPVGALDVAVVAVRPTEGAVEPLPGRGRLLGRGESLYLVATPEAIRKVEVAASPPNDERATASSGPELPPDAQVDAARLAGESHTAPDDTDDAGGRVGETGATVDRSAGPSGPEGTGETAATEQREALESVIERSEGQESATGGDADGAGDIELGDPDLTDLDIEDDETETDDGRDADGQNDRGDGDDGGTDDEDDGGTDDGDDGRDGHGDDDSHASEGAEDGDDEGSGKRHEET